MNRKTKLNLIATLIAGSALVVTLPIFSNSVDLTTESKTHGSSCSCGSCS